MSTDFDLHAIFVQKSLDEAERNLEACVRLAVRRADELRDANENGYDLADFARNLAAAANAVAVADAERNGLHRTREIMHAWSDDRATR